MPPAESVAVAVKMSTSFTRPQVTIRPLVPVKFHGPPAPEVVTLIDWMLVPVAGPALTTKAAHPANPAFASCEMVTNVRLGGGTNGGGGATIAIDVLDELRVPMLSVTVAVTLNVPALP